MVAPLGFLLWRGTLVAGVFACLLALLSGLTVTPASGLILVLMLLVSIGFAGAPRSYGKLLELIEALALFGIVSTIGAVLSYVIMRETTGFTDVLLDRWDRTLGMSWPAIHRVACSSPCLMAVLRQSYLAFTWLPLIVFTLAQRSGVRGRMQVFILAYALSLATTMLVFLFFPAEAAFAFYRTHGALTGVDLPGYNSAIAELRDGRLAAIDLAHMEGIVTFPSFHAAMAVLFVWGSWTATASWYLRLPILGLNALLWAAAVPIGGHYVVDLLGGTAIAVGAIWVAERLATRIDDANIAVAAPYRARSVARDGLLT